MVERECISIVKSQCALKFVELLIRSLTDYLASKINGIINIDHSLMDFLEARFVFKVSFSVKVFSFYVS